MSPVLWTHVYSSIFFRVAPVWLTQWQYRVIVTVRGMAVTLNDTGQIDRYKRNKTRKICIQGCIIFWVIYMYIYIYIYRYYKVNIYCSVLPLISRKPLHGRAYGGPKNVYWKFMMVRTLPSLTMDSVVLKMFDVVNNDEVVVVIVLLFRN